MEPKRIEITCKGAICRNLPRDKRNLAAPMHTCPYQVDVNDNDKFMCDCCDDCTTECADNI